MILAFKQLDNKMVHKEILLLKLSPKQQNQFTINIESD